MGKYDSTQTRVTPVFDQLAASETSWLEPLLSLPSAGHPQPLLWAGRSMRVDELRFGQSEKALSAPDKLLKWLTRNAQDVSGKGLVGLSAYSAQKRRLLLERDPAVIAEAKELLASSRADHQWFVLEGPSYPDVFIGTPDLIVVIEGKRTESGPTIATTWMSPRHQMLRHMDCALEASAGRMVLGLFVVEGARDGTVPGVWAKASADTISPAALDSSLPHRSAAERELIARGFLGVTTWQAICRKFAIDQRTLPNTV
jgi:hypothetical protein